MSGPYRIEPIVTVPTPVWLRPLTSPHITKPNQIRWDSHNLRNTCVQTERFRLGTYALSSCTRPSVYSSRFLASPHNRFSRKSGPPSFWSAQNEEQISQLMPSLFDILSWDRPPHVYSKWRFYSLPFPRCCGVFYSVMIGWMNFSVKM